MKKNMIGAILALLHTAGFLAILALLVFGAVPPENEKYFYIALGALIGFANTAVQFYLGSSLGSSNKTDLLARGGGGTSPPDKGDIPAAASGS